jgi:hypothetical protein
LVASEVAERQPIRARAAQVYRVQRRKPNGYEGEICRDHHSASTSSCRAGGAALEGPVHGGPGHGEQFGQIDDFLADLANAYKPPSTIRAYRGDLIAFAAHHDGEIAGVTAAPVRSPATIRNRNDSRPVCPLEITTYRIR